MTSDHLAEAHTFLDAFRSRDSHVDETTFLNLHLQVDGNRRSALAKAFDKIGSEAFNGGRLDAARDSFWTLFMLRLEQVKGNPDDRVAIRDFASAEDLLGVTLLKLGRIDPAEQMLTEAHRYRAGLWRDEPSDPHAAYLHGVALWHMAKLERAKGNDVAEVDWCAKAHQHLVAVDAEWPGVSFIVDVLAAVKRRLEDLSTSGFDPRPRSSRVSNDRHGFWRRVRSLLP